MCYSPEADVIAGLVVGTIGIDAMRHVDDRRYLALASVPLVLATHQLIEAVAWWGLRGQVPAEAGEFAAATYLVIALGVVPFLVPFAVIRAEPNPTRRQWMAPFVVMGGMVAVVMLSSLGTNGYTVAIGGRYLAYEVAISNGGIFTAFYFAAVGAPLLLSSHRKLVLFGAVNVPVFLGLTLLLSQGLISLWCVWAAISSLVVARLIRDTGAERERANRGVVHAR
ncbi:MAG: DUF6629 family protein [Acidimicrobiia bacterium]